MSEEKPMTESEGKLLEALRPFADCVFNDNGDVTYTFSNARPEDYFRAYRLVRNSDIITSAQPTLSPRSPEQLRKLADVVWNEAMRDFIRWKLANPQAKIPTHPNVTEGIGRWLSAALDDPNVCDDMKADIQKWFDAGSPSPASEAGREPVAWITKAGLNNFLQGTDAESHILLRSGNSMRVALYASPPHSANQMDQDKK